MTPISVSDEKQNLYVLKGVIAELPEDQRHKTEIAADLIRKIVVNYGDEGVIGLTLIALEFAAKE